MICLVPHRFWQDKKRPHVFCEGDTFTHGGRTFKVMFPYDDYNPRPWEDEDGHGPVREVRHHRGDRPVKAAGERVLSSDRWNAWLYDWQAAIKQAKEERWGWWRQDPDYIKFLFKHWRKPTRGEIAEHAVRQDFNYLRGWLNEEWTKIGVMVECVGSPHHGDEWDGAVESAWGIESNDYTYQVDLAYELADQINRDLDLRLASYWEDEARREEAARPDLYPWRDDDG